ncbi:unnamed protein product [Ilex paraguariensis]|uniref:Uncharacterized protein n=1 Tax=Ilex paraguariensis TaxID=185542 RepID=A0ABC8SNK1_9AQUA
MILYKLRTAQYPNQRHNLFGVISISGNRTKWVITYKSDVSSSKNDIIGCWYKCFDDLLWGVNKDRGEVFLARDESGGASWWLCIGK